MGQVAKKILVLGSKGMAGHVVLHYLLERGLRVHDVARDHQFFEPKWCLDVRDLTTLGKVIEENGYTHVVNCVGVLNQAVDNNPAEGILLNSYLPHFLATTLDKVGGRLIHISTDCVFSGEKGNYTENDRKDGYTLYAQTKSVGEVTYGDHLTIRTSIIGPELKQNGIGLMHWFLQQQGNIKGYTNAYWSGVTTLELAKTIFWDLEQQQLKGLIHLTNNKKISKYKLLGLLQQEIGNDKITGIDPYPDYYTDKSLVNTRADMSYLVPDYPKMLAELKDWIARDNITYKLYDVLRKSI